MACFPKALKYFNPFQSFNSTLVVMAVNARDTLTVYSRYFTRAYLYDYPLGLVYIYTYIKKSSNSWGIVKRHSSDSPVNLNKLKYKVFSQFDHPLSTPSNYFFYFTYLFFVKLFFHI